MDRKPRTPGLVYLALSVVLIVLLALFALTTRQTPPPTIAEFAPQSVDNITEAPTDQSSGSGSGPGDCVVGVGGACEGAGGIEASPTPPPPIDVPRVRKCVGDPPRQIEDPQSPPCVPYWAGDNGGATSKGVTRDEIIVVMPEYNDIDRVFERFFNSRFEFYGRTMRFKKLAGNYTNNVDTSERAAATEADEEIGAFAVGQKFEFAVMYEELARRGIIGTPRDGTFTDAAHARYAPYLWSYTMSADRVARMLGNMACAQLAGRPPSHSGIVAPKRVFGLLTMERPNRRGEAAPLVSTLERALAACGEHLEEKAVIDQNEWATGTANIYAKFKLSGINSVFVLGNSAQFFSSQPHATAQDYYPEWIVSSYIQFHLSWWARTGGQDTNQMSHIYGLTMVPRETPLDQQPAWWAIREADPSRGEERVNDDAWQIEYRSALLIASGIQMAGPNLTPKTFADGLHRVRFPNPYHPIMAGTVGFQDGDYSMTDDAAQMWWSNNDRGVFPGDGMGRWCYVDGGRRFKLGAFPKGSDAFFETPCERAPAGPHT